MNWPELAQTTSVQLYISCGARDCSQYVLASVCVCHCWEDEGLSGVLHLSCLAFLLDVLSDKVEIAYNGLCLHYRSLHLRLSGDKVAIDSQPFSEPVRLISP